VTSSAIASIKPTLAMNPDPEMPSWMTMLFAVASGLLAANVYYSQPIAELIATSLGFSSSGLAYALGGWSLASWIGLALPMLALASFLMDWIRGHA
jgi:hypothetical protein